jgi:hypothetical protein
MARWAQKALKPWASKPAPGTTPWIKCRKPRMPMASKSCGPPQPSSVLVAPNVSLETALTYSEVMSAPNGMTQNVMTFMGSVRDKLTAGTALSGSDMDNIQLVLNK